MEMMEPQGNMASTAAAAEANAVAPGVNGGGVPTNKKIAMLRRILDDDDDVSSSENDTPKPEVTESKPEKVEEVAAVETKPRLQRRGSSEKKKKEKSESTSKEEEKEAREQKPRTSEKKPTKSKSVPEMGTLKVRSERLQLREALKESTETTAAVEESAKAVVPRKRPRSGEKDAKDTPAVEETKPKRPRMTRQESLEELEEEQRKREERKAQAAKTRRDRLQRRGSKTSDDGETNGGVAVAVVEAPVTEEIEKSEPDSKPKRSRKEKNESQTKVEKVETKTTVVDAEKAVVEAEKVVVETKKTKKKVVEAEKEVVKATKEVVQTKTVLKEEAKVVKPRRVRAISTDGSEIGEEEVAAPSSRRDRDQKRSADAKESKAVEEDGDAQRQRKRIKRPLSATSNGNSKKPSTLASLLDRESAGGSEKPADRGVSRVKEDEKRRVKPSREDQRPPKRREDNPKSLDDFLNKERGGQDVKLKAKKHERLREEAPASLDDYLKAKENAPRRVKEKKPEERPRDAQENGAQEENGTEEEPSSLPRRMSEEGRVAIHNLLSQDDEENGENVVDPTDASQSADAEPVSQPVVGANAEKVGISVQPTATNGLPPVQYVDSTKVEVLKKDDEEEGVASDPEEAPEPVVSTTKSDAVKAEEPAPAAHPMSFVIPKKRNIPTATSREPIRPSSTDPQVRRQGAPAPQASPMAVSSVESTPVSAPAPRQRRTKNAVPPRLTAITPREKDFLRLSKKSNSFFKAASMMTVQKAIRGAKVQPGLVSAFGCTTVRYGVLLQPPNVLFNESTKRMECPTRTHIKRANHPPAFFGVSMNAPPLATAEETKIETTQDEDVKKKEKTVVPCYETLEFDRSDDRDWYQQLMYGTPFVPQLLRERVTLVMHNARYKRKATGMHFNAQRDKELYCESLAQRYTMNRSVPRCDILPRNWQQLANGRTSFVFLHYMNREDAEQARRVFKDDEGQSLTFKNETRRSTQANGQGVSAPAPGRSPPPPMSSPPQPPRRRSPSPRQGRYRDRGPWPPRDHNVDYRDREDRGRRPYDGGPPRSPPPRPRGRSRSRSRSPRRGSHHDFASQSRDLERAPPSQEHERLRADEQEDVKIVDKVQDSSQATNATHDSSMDGEEGLISSQNDHGMDEIRRGGDREQSQSHSSQTGRSRSRSRSRQRPREVHDHHREPLAPRSRSPPGVHRGYDDRSFQQRDRRGSREFHARGVDNGGRRGSFGGGRSPGPSSQEWMDRDRHGRDRDRYGAPAMNAEGRYDQNHDHARHHDQHAYRDHRDNRDYRPPHVPDDRRARHGSDDYRRPHDHRDHRDRGGHY